MSLAQLKVMSAIEACRTAALGGHLERCEDCAHTRVATDMISSITSPLDELGLTSKRGKRRPPHAEEGEPVA